MGSFLHYHGAPVGGLLVRLWRPTLQLPIRAMPEGLFAALRSAASRTLLVARFGYAEPCNSLSSAPRRIPRLRRARNVVRERERAGKSGKERERAGKSGKERGRAGKSGEERGRAGKSGEERGRAGKNGEERGRAKKKGARYIPCSLMGLNYGSGGGTAPSTATSSATVSAANHPAIPCVHTSESFVNVPASAWARSCSTVYGPVCCPFIPTK